MSSRYGRRDDGRYGDSEDERISERIYERDTERGQGAQGSRYERGSEYGAARRGGYSALRGAREREYGPERDYSSRYGAREYGSGEYGARYGRGEVPERGGYTRRYEAEDYGRVYGVRPHGPDYERRFERPHRREEEADEVREYDTDYGRTTSRFYGRSGYEYGREDYEGERAEHKRRAAYGQDEDRRGDGGSWLDRAADQVRSWLGSDEEREGEHRRHNRGEGHFRGRGPKNYRRSDDRLREDVCDRLTDNEWIDASNVEVNVVAAEVILTGNVDSRYAKRLAESIADSVSGVSHVQNNLRVQSYQAGMDTPLPEPTAPSIPAAELTAATDPIDVRDPGRTSSKAAGKS